jgi:hypothetical protein
MFICYGKGIETDVPSWNSFQMVKVEYEKTARSTIATRLKKESPWP